LLYGQRQRFSDEADGQTLAKMGGFYAHSKSKLIATEQSLMPTVF
jgi:hypothetical protein